MISLTEEQRYELEKIQTQQNKGYITIDEASRHRGNVAWSEYQDRYTKLRAVGGGTAVSRKERRELLAEINEAFGTELTFSTVRDGLAAALNPPHYRHSFDDVETDCLQAFGAGEKGPMVGECAAEVFDANEDSVTLALRVLWREPRADGVLFFGIFAFESREYKFELHTAKASAANTLSVMQLNRRQSDARETPEHFRIQNCEEFRKIPLGENAAHVGECAVRCRDDVGNMVEIVLNVAGVRLHPNLYEFAGHGVLYEGYEYGSFIATVEKDFSFGTLEIRPPSKRAADHE